AGPVLGVLQVEDARTLEVGMALQSGRLVLTEVAPDQPEVLAGRIGGELDAGGVGRVLPPLLHTPAVAIVPPAVVHEALPVALDGPGRELGAAVGAAEAHDVGRATLASVQGEPLRQDADGDPVAGPKVFGSKDRGPEAAQVAAGQRIRSGLPDQQLV